MHGEDEITSIPRFLCTVVHLFLLSLAAWIYFFGGQAVLHHWFSIQPVMPGNVARRTVLLAFGVLLFLRLNITMFVFLKRKFGWSEMGGVVFALVLYQDVFALLGVGETAPLGWPDAAGILIFLSGSVLNSGSEFQRQRFKSHADHRGRLYTGGLFRYARHINYFGDTLWVTGWAILTRNPFALLVPLWITFLFVFVFIPALTKHLKQHYGEQFDAWAAQTNAFVPFVY